MKSTIVKCEICGKLQRPVESRLVMRHVCCLECGVRVIDAAMDFADHINNYPLDDPESFDIDEFDKFLTAMLPAHEPETDPANN